MGRGSLFVFADWLYYEKKNLTRNCPVLLQSYLFASPPTVLTISGYLYLDVFWKITIVSPHIVSNMKEIVTGKTAL